LAQSEKNSYVIRHCAFTVFNRILANEIYQEATTYLKEKATNFVEENSSKSMDVLVSNTTSKQVCIDATLNGDLSF